MQNTFTLLFVFLFIAVDLQAQTIVEIQGSGDASPYANQEVTTRGIITGTHVDGYYLQDGTDVRSGIYVYDQTYTPSVGDSVEITGTVEEFFDLTEIKNLSAFTIFSSGNPLPAPLSLATNDVNQEDYEAMLVQVTQATCTNPDLGFNEFQLDDGSGPCVVDDFLYLYVASQGVDYTVTGPLHYSFGAYKIVPRNAEDVEIAEALYFTVAPKESNLSTTGMTITWETNVPASSKVIYGTSPDLLLMEVENSDLTASHTVTLDNLDHGSIYYFQASSTSSGETTESQTRAVATASLSSGEIRVYFNHPVDESVATTSSAVYTSSITDTIISYIDRAQTTLDFTMYEAQNEAIVDALNVAYDRGVSVRVISDDEGDNETLIENLDPNIPVFEGNDGGLMHNKFMVVDRDNYEDCWVLTGSMNHTINNLGWDYNNIICVQDQSLAKTFTLEFEEMWGSTSMTPDLMNAKFGADKTDNTPHCFNLQGTRAECYFSPSDGVTNKIVAAIDAAQSELAFAILVFTENSLGNAVLAAHNRGVDVKGIIDYVEFNGDEYDFLLDNGVNVQDYQNADGAQWPDGPTLHHKYAIIDYAQTNPNTLLITGSHNWTASAASIHDENTLFIYDAEIANWYQQEFWARFFGLDVSTSETFVENQLYLYPNPATDVIRIKTALEGTAWIYDNQGKLMYSLVLRSADQRLSVASLPAGQYVIRVNDGEKNYVERFVKF
jgi:phosphatidylserine/phosphatidylglycerophosphate/cardiolipin synthase-like enzyme